MGSRPSRGAERVHSEALRDVATLRGLFSSHGLIALFDAPWLVVYVAVIWLCHPLLGVASVASAVLMLLLTVLNDRLTRRGIEAVQREAALSGRYLEASLANAEVVETLGMAPALVGRWRQLNQKVNELQRPVARTSVALASAARSLRQVIQIAILAIGAYLVVTHEATPGVMIATTILLGARCRRSSRSWRAGGAAGAHGLPPVARCSAGLERIPSCAAEPRGALAAQNLFHRAPAAIASSSRAYREPRAGEALAVVGPSAAASRR